MTWVDAQEAFSSGKVALIPLGSTEQHGPHNPVGTDWIVPRYIASKIGQRSPSVFITPVLPFGYADYHSDFPGTISISEETLYHVLSDITESLARHGVTHFIFLDGHGGNAHSCDRVCYDLRRRGLLGATILWWDVIGVLDSSHSPAGHGDWVETAMTMAAVPQAVRMERATPPPAKPLSADLRLLTPHLIDFEGVPVHVVLRTKDFSDQGDMYEWGLTPNADLTVPPTAADAELGEQLCDLVADFVCRFVETFRAAHIDPLPESGAIPVRFIPPAERAHSAAGRGES